MKSQSLSQPTRETLYSFAEYEAGYECLSPAQPDCLVSGCWTGRVWLSDGDPALCTVCSLVKEIVC